MGLLDNKPLNSPSGLPTQTQIQESVRKWQPDPAMFRLSEYFEDDTADAQVVEWDEIDEILGMANDWEPDSEVPEITQRGITTKDARAFYIKESGKITGREIDRRRRSGDPTRNGGEEAVMWLAEQLFIRRETRKEWMRTQAFGGSITFNNRTVDYGIPNDNKPTMANLWSNLATGNPIEDIQTLMLMFRGVGHGIRCLFTQKIANLLARNEVMRDLFRQSSMAGELGPANVAKLLNLMVSDGKPITFEVYDQGYKAESDATYTTFLDDTKFYMVANPPMGQKLGTWTSAPTSHHGLVPKAGPFVLVDDRLQTKHNYYEMTQGEYGIVTLKHPKNIIVATVASYS